MVNKHAVDNEHGSTEGVFGGEHGQLEDVHGGFHRSGHLDALAFSVNTQDLVLSLD
jgi:hypothetical protein